MNKENAENTRTIRENMFAVFGILMFLIYLAIGVSLLAVPTLLNDYPISIKVALGVLFIVYALFRLMRIIRSLRN
jgi:uncharacterized membrane protein